jgi:DsbC/DsbD-like thiol-disulfide interchange protein
VPISFVQPGDIAGYGYEGTVTLAAQVRVPESWDSRTADVRSSVSWLACKHVCVVGSATLEGKLPDVGGAAAFKGWRDRLPRPEAPFSTTVTGGLEGNDRRATLSVWLQWADPPGSVEFFPVGGERLKAGVERVATRGNLTRVDLAVSVVGAGSSAPDSLTAVVAAEGPAGGRPGWQVTIPVRGAHNETDD